ncbi:MAG: peroxiredoxin [Cyanobacteria bacterium K_DeepCast_35m_m2_023]|nr:peroxiredoxin [Cyanobacteria bacterium K_DeepCast_35m_m2_023]
MQRRELLSQGIQAGSLALLAFGLRPQPALALGGTLPDIGVAAPAFDLDGVAPAAGGEALPTHLTLAELAGSWLVLYFYPKDFTSGCTLEARGFQRDLGLFQAAGARVIGISADDPDQHASFCGSEGLTYPLLSDPGGKVSKAYGSWIPPFSQRHTFLVDPQGVLQARWTAVRPAGHSQEVLAELTRLQGVGS